MELIDKADVVAKTDARITSLKRIGSENYLHDNYPVQYAMLETLKSLKFDINTLEVKEANDAYKQGYNDAIDKFCKFMQSCEGYVVSGNKCNYENFIKYMEGQQ